MRTEIKKMLRKFGLRTQTELDLLERELVIWKSGFFPPGHYYSPMNNLHELKESVGDFTPENLALRDVDLNEASQLKLLADLQFYYNQLPFEPSRGTLLRYYYENPFFSYSDGIFLFCLLNHVKPKSVVEIGSGFSSALMLDTNELVFSNSIKLTFIEPYPEERLLKLLKKDDNSDLIKDFVQNVDLNVFRQLQAGDILFVDSSHVSKFRSDLNHILFHILPELESGVYIHFHDIFYPFEYPKEWILEGRAWNEIYLLRAFLMNNKQYEIVLFPSMMEKLHEPWLEANMPLTLKLHEKWPSESNFQYYLPHKGQSLWLKKL